MSKINIIVAVSTNDVIGRDNDLPWHLPNEFKYFKSVTLNKSVIMGRKCWESLPIKFRPLPKRLNVVLTKNTEYDADGALIMTNLESTIKAFRNTDLEVFIIGGSQIYKEAFKFADRVYLTRILSDVDGNVFLEGFNEDEWDLISESDVKEENGFKYVFLIYDRKEQK